MSTTWLGDHGLVQGLKHHFETEVEKLGWVPSDFAVTVTRLPNAPSFFDSTRYSVNIADVASQRNVKVQGGGGKDWVGESIHLVAEYR